MNDEEKRNLIQNSNKLCVYSEIYLPPKKGVYKTPITKEEALNLLSDCGNQISVNELKDSIHIVRNILF